MDGFINVYKAKGWTSHDVVQKLRGILKIRKIGHAGTLDPQVEGVLVVAVGKATRLLEYVEKDRKIYEAEILFGYASTTEDAYGEIIDKRDITLEDVVDFPQVLEDYQGEIAQVPPMYSAIKVQGKKLYELARLGKEVEREARKVWIYKTSLLQKPYMDEEGKIKAVFSVECSKGTYIRTYCKDLGLKLGLPALMSGLRRLAVGNYKLEDAFSLEKIAEMSQCGDHSFFKGLETGSSSLNKLELKAEYLDDLKCGRDIPLEGFNGTIDKSMGTVAVFFKERLMAIGEVIEKDKTFIDLRKVLITNEDNTW